MKYFLFFLFGILQLKAECQGKYELFLNDSSITVNADQYYTISVGGQQIRIFLKSLDTLQFKDSIFSFKYFKDYKISKTEIQKGATQMLLTTADGSGFIVQEYSILNPENLTELMLAEITKEKINYGYVSKREDYSRTLRTGQTLQIKRATLTYKEEVHIFEVAAIGGKDKGILIITQIETENYSKEAKKTINLLWDSLEYF